jgi:hypothetical protein
LRLRGPNRTQDTPLLIAINGKPDFAAYIDHNDVSDWPLSAVDLSGDHSGEMTCPAVLPVRLQTVRVLRNYIHDNFHGYGVVSGADSNPLTFANTFQKNHHGMSSDGYAFSAYSAVSNLFCQVVKTPMWTCTENLGSMARKSTISVASVV